MRIVLLSAAALAFAGCSEPKAPEPAPSPVVEAAPETPPARDAVNVPPAEVPGKLAGKWQAIEDAASILTITADGTWTNDYTGDDSVHDVAKWRAFAGAEIPTGADGLTFTPTSTYIEVISGENKFYYELGGIDTDNFDMFYVSRGNRLAYTRVK